MLTALTFLIILLILVLIHEFGHYYAAKKSGVYVEEFGFGFPPRAIGKKIGETLYSINWIPLGGFVKLFGEEYHEGLKDKGEKIPKHRAFVNKKPWQKTVIIVAGVVMNFLLGWILITYMLMVGVPQPAGVAVSEVQSGSPAASVGLKAQDKLVSLMHGTDTIKLRQPADLIRATKRFAGEPISILTSRNGEEQLVTLTPRENPPKGQGSLGILIEQLVETKKYPWYSAPYYGFIRAAEMTGTIAVEIIKIPASFLSKTTPAPEFSGPVGIAKIVGEARKYGMTALIEITAILSLNLAVINILPFPALDGGRLVFIIYEWVTGKKSNQVLEKYMNLFGIVFLLGLSAIITIMDIQKLF